MYLRNVGNTVQIQTQHLETGPCNLEHFSVHVCESGTFVLHRIHMLRDEKQELPEDFLSEIYKWALECK
jgi:hypothetical protein